MKEMYVKPMVEKIMFDVSIITTSAASVVAATTADICNTIVDNSGYNDKKNSSTCECFINNQNLNKCQII